MISQRLISLLIVSICLSPWAAYGRSDASPTITTAADSPDPQSEAGDIFSVAQVALVIVGVVLVAVLAAGCYFCAIDTETPEQRMQRNLNQEQLKAAAVALSVHYATTTALKKLK